jgi:hypothetical protein
MEKEKKRHRNKMRVKSPALVSRGLVWYTVLIPQYSRTTSETALPLHIPRSNGA